MKWALAAVSAASAAAAAAAAAASGSGILFPDEGSSYRRKVGEDKFAPRFDGLRFIETLVTAHR